MRRMNHAVGMATAHPPGSPFHAGEQALQARAGMRERIERAGRMMIRDFMPDQHREFFAAQPLVFVGSVDAHGRPWASMLTGDSGFMASPDARTLRVNALPAHGDPLASNLTAGAPLGLLGIEFESRRRNRANGTVTRLYQAGFEVRVEQSFGNCPKYIQARSLLSRAPAASQPVQAESQVLSERAQALVRRADTFFIATAAPGAGAGNPVEGVDVSHRGGKPGFVRAALEAGRSVLSAPDFGGNFLFNTFGNLLLNPRAALLFVDFDSGDLLSLTGEAEVLWDAPELAAFAGAQRLFRFRVEEGRLLERASPLRWSSPVQAPQLAATGSWDDPG
jgi:predicted pyridoxine 5'-phosphate oxidase superfamily flavin-nucleotide-binding protein